MELVGSLPRVPTFCARDALLDTRKGQPSGFRNSVTAFDAVFIALPHVREGLYSTNTILGQNPGVNGFIIW